MDKRPQASKGVSGLYQTMEDQEISNFGFEGREQTIISLWLFNTYERMIHCPWIVTETIPILIGAHLIFLSFRISRIYFLSRSRFCLSLFLTYDARRFRVREIDKQSILVKWTLSYGLSPNRVVSSTRFGCLNRVSRAYWPSSSHLTCSTAKLDRRVLSNFLVKEKETKR